MTAIRVYLDEDVHHFIAQALRLRGWEAATTREAGRAGSTDLEQIQFAADNGLCLLTYNASDFPRIHHELLGARIHHGGIIVATQEDPASNARTLLKLVSTFTADDFTDQLIYLNNWT